MIRKFHINILILIAALALVGCRDMGLNGSELPQGVAGEATETVIHFGTPAFSAKVSRADQAVEQRVTSLAVFVFDHIGRLKNSELINSVDVSEPLKMRTTQGAKMRVVAVANYRGVSGLANELAQIKDYQSLIALAVTQNVATSGALLMVSDQEVDITPNAQIRLEFKYAVAKVNLVVKVSERFPANEALDIVKVELGSMPASGGLFETSPVQSTFVALQPLTMQGDLNRGMTTTFYTLPNLAGGRVSKAPPAGGEKEGTSNAHWFKRHYAPQTASYMVIHAMHRTATTTRRVELYVYFGHDDSKDYNVKASEQHTYTATIHGFDKMDVDTNVEYETMELHFSLGNNTPMDAHADMRALYVDASSGLMDVEVLSGGDWLSVSPLDLQQHQVRQAGNVWQQNGAVGSFVRPKHKPVQGALVFADATYALCLGLKDIPMAGERSLYLHATENTTKANRTAQVKLTFKKSDGQSQSEVLTLSQRAAIDLGDGMAMEWAEEYAIESYKDAPAQLKAHSGMQWGYASTMLNVNSDRFFNGAFATANAVYGTGEKGWSGEEKDKKYFVQPEGINSRPTWDASIAYRTKYASNQNKYEKVAEPYTLAVEAPYYTPNYAEAQVTYSPVYGSSAARYCHEKNRDANGDGVLTPDETEWFLPSVGELAHIWVVWNGLEQAARPEASTAYWSASEQEGSMAASFSFTSGVSEASGKKALMRVRCVRRNVGVAAAVQYVNGMVVVDNSDLPSGAWSSVVKVSAPASKESNAQLAKRFVVAKRDASTDRGAEWHTAMGLSDQYRTTLSGDCKATEQTGCAAYTEQANGTDMGQWRLPTARELVRLWTLSYEIGRVAPNGFVTMQGIGYWSASENSRTDAWSMPFEAAPKTFLSHNLRTQMLSVRCVREF